MNFIKSFSIYFIANFISKMLAFVAFIYASKIISPSEYGIIGLVNSFFSFFAAIVMLGLPSLVLTHFIDYNNTQKYDLLSSINNIFYRSYLFFLVIIILLISFFDWKPDSISSFEYIFIIVITLLIIFFNIFNQLVINIFRMENKISSLAKITILNSILSFIFIIIFVNSFVGYLSLLLAIFISSLIFFTVFQRNFKQTLYWIPTKKLDFSLFNVSIPIMLGSLFGVLLLSTDKWMIGYFLGLNEVGIYEVAFKFGILYDVLFAQVFNAIYLPWLLNKLKVDYQNYFKFNILLAAINAGVLIILTFYTPDWFWNYLKILIGEDFYASIIYIKYLIIYYIVLHSISMLYIFFIYSKSTKYILYNTVFLALINGLLNLYFIPEYGIFGSIYSSYMSLGLSLFVIFVFFRQKLFFEKLNKEIKNA